IVIDVANAANERVYEFTKKVCSLKNAYGGFDVVVGNIATAEAAKKYKELDIDGLKVGVGAGATCTTRLMTGVGVPQLAAIRDVVSVLRKSDIKIIADGGISQPGDAVKALSAGADSVMMGKVLAFAKESPGWNFKAPEYGVKQWTKIYKGEASFRPDRTHEGVTHNIILDVGKEPKPVEEILLDYTGGLRSAMSYLNAQNIKHLQENAVFIEVSTNTLIENRTRP
ncbi:IMP dehydrogenase, partial [Patescibacteria group bacterium]|nr:IMP dehydrogenase [Patescibacteria group bacterium]